MMSNHAEGFKHITFNTVKPIKTRIGDFEWQLISARLILVILPLELITNTLEQNFILRK